MEKTKGSGKRIVYLDILRIVSAFFIVFLHVSAQKWADVPVTANAWKIFNAYDGAVRWAVPVFVMISGALLLERSYTLKELYRKHVRKIGVVFVFWSLLYTLSQCVIAKNIVDAKGFFIHFFRGHYHLWFLYMIAGIYIVMPILKRIVKDPKTAKYFMILAFIFAFTVPFVLDTLGLFSKSAASVGREATGYMQLNLVLGYSGYFVLGYILNRREVKRSTAVVIYLLGAAALAFTVLATQKISQSGNVGNPTYYSYTGLNVALTCIAVFLFAKRNLNFTLRSGNALAFLSKCAFGVYLIHPFVLEFFRAVLKVDTLSFNAALSVPAISAAVFLISLGISAALNCIPGVRKWLV